LGLRLAKRERIDGAALQMLTVLAERSCRELHYRLTGEVIADLRPGTGCNMVRLVDEQMCALGEQRCERVGIAGVERLRSGNDDVACLSERLRSVRRGKTVIDTTDDRASSCALGDAQLLKHTERLELASHLLT
jgi:hypothetical protein